MSSQPQESNETLAAILTGKLRRRELEVNRQGATITVKVNSLTYDLVEVQEHFLFCKLTYGSLEIPEASYKKTSRNGRINYLADKLVVRVKQLMEYVERVDESRPKPTPTLTVEILDELLRTNSTPLIDEFSGEAWDRLYELLWGSDKHLGVLTDILILARIALVHLRGASFLVHEDTKTIEASEPTETGVTPEG